MVSAELRLGRFMLTPRLPFRRGSLTNPLRPLRPRTGRNSRLARVAEAVTPGASSAMCEDVYTREENVCQPVGTYRVVEVLYLAKSTH